MGGDGKPIRPGSDNGYVDGRSHVCEILGCDSALQPWRKTIPKVVRIA
jgi:hypothetical protein